MKSLWVLIVVLDGVFTNAGFGLSIHTFQTQAACEYVRTGIVTAATSQKNNFNVEYIACVEDKQ
jgi:hypothetical protein